MATSFNIRAPTRGPRKQVPNKPTVRKHYKLRKPDHWDQPGSKYGQVDHSLLERVQRANKSVSSKLLGTAITIPGCNCKISAINLSYN